MSIIYLYWLYRSIYHDTENQFGIVLDCISHIIVSVFLVLLCESIASFNWWRLCFKVQWYFHLDHASNSPFVVVINFFLNIICMSAVTCIQWFHILNLPSTSWIETLLFFLPCILYEVFNGLNAPPPKSCARNLIPM